MFDIFIDNKYVKTIDISGKRDTVLLSEKLTNTDHHLRIIKRNETNNHPVVFYGLVIDDRAILIKPKSANSRKIEFIGDSYTAGFANETTSRECTPSEADLLQYTKTNTGKSFGALISSTLHAEFQINAISGKGLVRNYNGFDKGNEFLKYYERTLLSSVFNQSVNASPWNFAWHPDVIVIGIGINDFQADPPYADSLQFDKQYTDFVKQLQLKHPGVKIICCATKIWPSSTLIPRVKHIVDLLSRGDNKNVAYFEYETENNALYGHPSISDHIKIANELTPVILKITGWKQ